MRKYDLFKSKIVDLIEQNPSNTEIAKLLLPDANFYEIEYLRKYIGVIRRCGLVSS